MGSSTRFYFDSIFNIPSPESRLSSPGAFPMLSSKTRREGLADDFFEYPLSPGHESDAEGI